MKICRIEYYIKKAETEIVSATCSVIPKFESFGLALTTYVKRERTKIEQIRERRKSSLPLACARIGYAVEASKF